MTKSELINRIYKKYKKGNTNNREVSIKYIEKSVNYLIDTIANSLSDGNRVEIRGFGGFDVHYCKDKIGRNPKNGKDVFINAKYIPHFKPGKELKDRVNNSVNKKKKELI